MQRRPGIALPQPGLRQGLAIQAHGQPVGLLGLQLSLSGQQRQVILPALLQEGDTGEHPVEFLHGLVILDIVAGEIREDVRLHRVGQRQQGRAILRQVEVDHIDIQLVAVPGQVVLAGDHRLARGSDRLPRGLRKAGAGKAKRDKYETGNQGLAGHAMRSCWWAVPCG